MKPPLTSQQVQILDLLANSDYTPGQIAKKLRLEDSSLRLHCSIIRQLFRVQTDFGAVKKSIQSGLIEYR